jgi:hypothetical protein
VLDWKHLNTLSKLLNGDILNVEENFFATASRSFAGEVAVA